MTPLREYGLLGDGHTAALVSSSGAIDWWCAPRFDSPPVLDALLGGHRRVATVERGRAEAFAYEPDTNVLHGRWGDAEAWWLMPYPRRVESRIVILLRERGTTTRATAIRSDGEEAPLSPREAASALRDTMEAWRAWVGDDAPPNARRSLLALKLLTYEPTGAVIAAPTTSLPEVVGGVRNWDYRYAWIRDTAFCALAYAAWGKRDEAARIARWLVERVIPHDGLSVLYRVDGGAAPDEATLDLSGYADSRPVRTGNGAIRQFQLDGYGHVIETLDACHALDGGPLEDAWSRVGRLVDEVIRRRHEPDNGIWEVPAGASHHTYSKVMAWLALDRGIRIGEQHGLPIPNAWRAEREAAKREVLERGLDPDTGAFTQAYGTRAADASTLRIPLLGFVGTRSPESRATLDLVERELLAGPGLVRRYRTPDGLPGDEGAFLACSFWLAELQHAVGRARDAQATLDRAEALGGDLGLLPEEIDPATGAFLGNYPQAISHASHLCAVAALARPSSARSLEA